MHITKLVASLCALRAKDIGDAGGDCFMQFLHGYRSNNARITNMAIAKIYIVITGGSGDWQADKSRKTLVSRGRGGKRGVIAP